MKMVAHVNGWSAIERQLRLQAKKQGELARVLEISQAAVSLMKKGSFLLNPGQLEKIAQFLRFDEETRCEFYTELFNARLISRTASAEPAGEEEGTYRVSRSPLPERKRMCEVPLAELGLLSGYEPLLEPLVDYLLRSSSERRTEALSGTGLCALRVGAEQEKIGLTAGSIILLESGRYPEPGLPESDRFAGRKLSSARIPAGGRTGQVPAAVEELRTGYRLETAGDSRPDFLAPPGSGADFAPAAFPAKLLNGLFSIEFGLHLRADADLPETLRQLRCFPDFVPVALARSELPRGNEALLRCFPENRPGRGMERAFRMKNTVNLA